MEIDPLRDLARTARRLPGYRKLRRTLVPKIRRNKVARMVAHRIFGSSARRGGGADLSAGQVIDGVGKESLPVVIVLIESATAARAQAVADQIAQAQLLSANFKPLFVLDAPFFAPFRTYGFAVDLILPRITWTGTDLTWTKYVGRRLARLTTQFDAHAIVRACESDEISEVDRHFLNELGAPRHRTG